MNDNGLGNFVERFTGVAAETDWSRYPQLQAASEYDIRAAGQALWIRWNPRPGYGLIIPQDVEKSMLSQVKRYDDRDELVSVEFEEYWDATDTQNFTSGLLEEMKRELSDNFMAERREAGCVVVNNEHGIWIFKFPEEW